MNAGSDLQTYVRRLVDSAREYAAERNAHYTSTACHHERHSLCRLTCKYCVEKCRCKCHERQWS